MGNEKQIFTRFYHGHCVEITIDSVVPNVKVEDLPDWMIEEIEDDLHSRIWKGDFDETDEDVSSADPSEQIITSLAGTWRVLPESIRIARWKKQSPPEYQLTVDDFISVFSQHGKIYFKVWNDTFDKDEAQLIWYLGHDSKEAYNFARMLMEKVEEYDVYSQNRN